MTTGVPDTLLTAFAKSAAEVPSNLIGEAPPPNIIREYTERCDCRNATTRKQVDAIIATLRSIIATIDIASELAAEFKAKIIQSAATPAATPAEIKVSAYFDIVEANTQHAAAGSSNKRGAILLSEGRSS